MWQAFRRGEWFRAAQGGVTVRADRIRYLLLAQSAAEQGCQTGLRMGGVRIAGQLDLRDAALGGVVTFDRCEFTDPIEADGLSVASMTLSGCVVPGLNADRIRVDRDLCMTRSDVTGSVFLRDARIGAGLNFADARITPTGYDGADPQLIAPPYVGIDAGNAVVGGDFHASGLTMRGGLFLNLARIDGALGLRGARIPDGFIQAPSLIVGGVYAGRGFVLKPGPGGALYFPRATIRGALKASGSRIDGPVTLTHAQISAGVDLSSAEIARLDADNLLTAGDLDLTRSRISGLISLRGARIDGTADLAETEIGSTDGVSIQADGLVAFQLTVECHRPAGHVDLSHARVELLCDRAGSWPSGAGRPILNGFTYQQLGNDTATADRLAMLREATPVAEPQPYEQLASVLRAAGRDEESRQVLRERQRREARSGRWPRRLWGRCRTSPSATATSPDARPASSRLCSWAEPPTSLPRPAVARTTGCARSKRANIPPGTRSCTSSTSSFP